MTTTQESYIPNTTEDKLVGLLTELKVLEVQKTYPEDFVSEEAISNQQVDFLSGLGERKLRGIASHVLKSRMDTARDEIQQTEVDSPEEAECASRLNVLLGIEEVLDTPSTAKKVGAVALAKSFGRNTRSLWRAGMEDLEGTSKVKKIAAVATVGTSAVALAADIPLHETYIAQVGTRVYTHTHGSTMATGLANGAASLGVEGVISTGFVYALSQMPKFTDSLYKMIVRKDRGEKLQGVVSKGSYAFFYGSGALVFRNNKERATKSAAKDAIAATGAVAFLGAINTGIASGAAQILNFGIEHPFLYGYTNDLVDVIKSPVTWLALIAGRIGYKQLTNRKKLLKDFDSLSIPKKAGTKTQDLVTDTEVLELQPQPRIQEVYDVQ